MNQKIFKRGEIGMMISRNSLGEIKVLCRKTKYILLSGKIIAYTNIALIKPIIGKYLLSLWH